MKDDDARFIQGLETGDLHLLKSVPKAEKHSHMDLGGSLARFRELTQKSIADPPLTYANFGEFQDYILDELDPIFSTREGTMLAKLNTIEQAKADSVMVLEASIDDGFSYHFPEDPHTLIHYLDEAVERIHPALDFRPELGLGRTEDIQALEQIAFSNLESGYFKSIDLYGNEADDDPKKYQAIFRRAKQLGLKLKAHIGEFSPPDVIRRTIEVLELDEIQHGIHAAESKELMAFLAHHQIPLHICPSSNVMLGAVKSLATHPIRTLFDHQVRLSINTDDYLIFDSCLSNEYLSLFQAGLFTAAELNEIRIDGLRD